MYGVLTYLQMALCLLLSLLSWTAAAKSTRLVNSGSSERLHRKTRKLMFRTGWLSLAAWAVLACIAWISAVMPSVFREERILLHVPLIAAPLISVWCVTMPKLWRLWKDTERARDLMEASIRGRAAEAGMVLPFQATAIGAAAVCYYTWASPVAYEPLNAAVPLLLNLGLLIALWSLQERRYRRLHSIEIPTTARSSWHRKLRHFGIF